MAINNLRRTIAREDDEGRNALRAAPAAASAAAPTFDLANAEPIYEMVGQTEQDIGTPTLVGYRISTPLAGGQFRNDIFDVNGVFQRTTSSSGKENYGIPDLLKLAATAAGANYLLPALAGAGEAAAAGSLTAGITPEAIAAAEAALPAAAAPTAAAAAPFAAAAPELAAATAPATQLTPAAIEAGLGTPGYGYNAAAEASGLFNPATIGAGAALPFEAMLPAAAGAAGAAAAAAPAATAATQAGTMASAVSPFAFLAPAAATLLGSYLSGQTAKSAAETTAAATTKAAELQSQSAKEALDLQRRMYEESVARQQPYYQAGTNALAQMQGMTNAMPPAFQYRPEQLTTDPGYGFRLSEGLKALERSAAARGGLLSGGTGKALTRYGQEMGSQEYGNAYNRALTEYNALRQREGEQYNRLAGLAGVGGTTAQQLTSAGQQYGSQAGNILTGMASNVGNLTAQQGQTAANALLAQGSAYQRGLGDIASLYAKMYGPQQPTYVLPYAPPGG